MTRLEHLLFILSEECDETGQRCAKAARFGILETQPSEPGGEIHKPNNERLCYEFSQAIGVYEMLLAEGYVPPIDREIVEAKKVQVEHFFQRSREMGTLNE